PRRRSRARGSRWHSWSRGRHEAGWKAHREKILAGTFRLTRQQEISIARQPGVRGDIVVSEDPPRECLAAGTELRGKEIKVRQKRAMAAEKNISTAADCHFGFVKG